MKKNKSTDLPYPVVFVIWEDAHTTDEEHIDPEIFDDPRKQKFYYAHVGWLIKDHDEVITLAYCVRFDGDVESDVSIPRSAIRYMEYLK